MADSKEIFGNITGVKIYDPDSAQWSEWKTSHSDIYKEYILPYLPYSSNRYQLMYRIQYNSDWEARRLTFYGVASYDGGEDAASEEAFLTPFARNDISDGSRMQVEGTTETIHIEKGKTEEIRTYGVLGSLRYFTGERTLYYYVESSRGSYESPTGSLSRRATFRAIKCGALVFPPELSISSIPTSLAAGDRVRIIIQNRADIRTHLVLSANAQTLYEGDSDSDNYTISTDTAWFETAGIASNSMQIAVNASDEYDRTATTSFTLTRPLPLSVTATAPKSTTLEGSNTIAFSWSVSGAYGTQQQAELQYSYDNATWQTLGSVSGSGTVYNAARGLFRAGTVYWRVRVLSTYNLWSAWSSSASFTVKYDAASYVVPLNSPTGGTVNASQPITFAGTLRSTGTPYEPFTMAAATLYWRSRTADPYTAVTMATSGANASVTIPGGTFPSGAVYWYIAATDNTGASSQTDVYTISTIASEIDAAPIAPVGVIETKNTPTVFSWRYATVTGSEQMAAELQYSIDNAAWIDFGSVAGSATSYTAPANALPSGTIYWRVRAENAAGVWGPWSASVSYVNFGAPDVFSVLTDGKPYTTITWQVNTQESYRLFVDGRQIGPYHGEDVRSYTLTQPLEDGQHSVQVQVQNEYSQWSPINGTVFDVTNEPTAEITLRQITDIDTELSWTGGDGTADFYVYRDGVPIAHTGGFEHIDRVALGTHEYYVLEKLAGGYYNRSNTVTATPRVECPMITPLAGGKWLALALSMDAERLIQISEDIRTSERFVLGADYPEVSVGRHRTKRVSMDAAWLRSCCTPEEFRGLLGKAVILKLPGGDVVVGVLPAYALASRHYANAYTYTLTQANWRDYIDNA